MNTTSSLHGIEILLVEDAPAERALLSELQEEGAEVTLECSGESAAEVVRRREKGGRRFDAVVLDLHPTARESIVRLREDGYAGFLAVVASVPVAVVSTLREAGCDVVVSKAEVKEVLANHLGRPLLDRRAR